MNPWQENYHFDSGVSIIVPAKNEAAYIGDCIESLLKQDFSGRYEIIVVDNNSTDRTPFIAQQKGVRVVRCGAGSPSAVRNCGARQAKFDMLAFIDGDCTAPKGWIRKAYSFLAGNKAVGAYGGPCSISAEANWIAKAWSPDGSYAESILKKEKLAGANLFVRHCVFAFINGFDETLLTAEDDDLSHRVRKNGYEVVSDNGNAVIHHGYPGSLSQMFLKSVWHGSSQLRAHGILGDKVVLLTLLWLISLGLLLISIILHVDMIFNLSIAILLLIPALIALARIRKLPYLGMARIFFSSYTISFFVVSGRTVGMARELMRIARDSLRRIPVRENDPKH